MISATYLLTAVAVLAVTVLFWISRRRYKLPPGPIGLPFLGYAPFLSDDSYKDFYELSKKYGNVFSLYLGRSLFVILNDFKSVKEAFNQAAALDRPAHAFDAMPDKIGFAGHNGEEWIEQRRYTMRAMRDIGMGKGEFDKNLEDEVREFVSFVEQNAGRPYDPYDALSASVSNNITTLIFGKRLPMGDPGRQLMNEGVEAAAQSFKPGGLANLAPSLLRFLAAIGLTSHAKYRKQMLAFNQYLKKEIEKRRKHLNESGGEIFIDSFLKEIEKNKGKPTTNFHEKNMIGNAQALVIGGSETTRTSLLWLLIALVEYPEVQKKVQEEIDSVIGREGKCHWQERAKLPYTYATVMEGQRWRSVTPLNVIHSAGGDFKIGDYDVPKGANIIANNWAIHMNPDNWKSPEKFIPERFLLEDKSVTMQRPENYIPFSVGRRSCPGEFVALIEIFQYLQAIMQKFTVQAPHNKKMDVSGEFGTVFQPHRQEFLFLIRD
ncbi:cytochrome P450 2J2-like [Uloborus diversus]|uniref:cytochrome P450 2J2-like n=1 Tax=Uloborus diversus TaxID=327109 RepID=UPI002409F1D5|nr:cytochrome P450 2J2-like [Uloborus diversus]